MQYLRPKLPSTFQDGDDEVIRKNLVKLDVFYRDFVVTDVRQSPEYAVMQLSFQSLIRLCGVHIYPLAYPLDLASAISIGIDRLAFTDKNSMVCQHI